MKARRMQPGPGQESVWDFPRPPRLEPVSCPVRVEFAQYVIADSQLAARIPETSHPSTIYIPCEDIRMEFLQSSPGTSFCEWKGLATLPSTQAGWMPSPWGMSECGFSAAITTAVGFVRISSAPLREIPAPGDGNLLAARP
ncbi:MAG: DUF427 domain-containing protein [Bryobacterales bacterium]|nr:DUF427 domain-containing protein [Bryobacterales bacterium]